MKKVFFAIAVMIAFVSCTPKSTDNTDVNSDTIVVDTLSVDSLIDTVASDTIVVE